MYRPHVDQSNLLKLLGDFNIDLLRDSSNLEVENFMDTLQSNLLIPTITLPTRITENSKTLIDNIISSPSKFKILSGNLTVGISDHLNFYVWKRYL